MHDEVQTMCITVLLAIMVAFFSLHRRFLLLVSVYGLLYVGAALSPLT